MTWNEEIEENIKCGLVSILIMQLLSCGDMYGYQIRQEILERSGETINIKEGSLYGPLYKMQEKGLVSVRKELVGQKRFRNYFHLEESGKNYLAIAKEKYASIIGGANLIMTVKEGAVIHDKDIKESI